MRTATPSRPPSRPAAAAGFTLVELLVTIVVVAEILIIAGLMFDLHNKTARTQNQIAETQQSLRVAQREIVGTLRTAGRGGLPANLPPDPLTGVGRISPGVAIVVDDNVPAGIQIIADEPRTNVVPGTDVLHVRGVMTTPYYQLLSAGLGERNLRFTDPPGADENPGIANTGQVDVFSPSPSGFAQDLAPLLGAQPGDALILVSPLSDEIYGVVAFNNAIEIEGLPVGVTGVTVSFDVVGHDHVLEYGSLFANGPRLPNNLNSAAFVGLLEEHVFYIRETFAIPGDASSELRPKLAHVRVRPGTSVGLDGTGDDIADHILDLQVALGYNSNLGDGGYSGPEDTLNLVIDETADGAADDWLYNGVSDDATASPWAGPWIPFPGAVTPQPELQYVRLTTLARTVGREFRYVSPPIQSIENHVYGESAAPAARAGRAFHRRMLRTVVDMRNL